MGIFSAFETIVILTKNRDLVPIHLSANNILSMLIQHGKPQQKAPS